MKKILLYEEDDDKKNVLPNDVADKFATYMDDIKDYVDKLKQSASEFIDYASDYAENDLSPKQLVFRQYADAIMELLDNLDEKATDIEKENNVSDVI